MQRWKVHEGRLRTRRLGGAALRVHQGPEKEVSERVGEGNILKNNGKEFSRIEGDQSGMSLQTAEAQ